MQAARGINSRYQARGSTGVLLESGQWSLPHPATLGKKGQVLIETLFSDWPEILTVYDEFRPEE